MGRWRSYGRRHLDEESDEEVQFGPGVHKLEEHGSKLSPQRQIGKAIFSALESISKEQNVGDFSYSSCVETLPNPGIYFGSEVGFLGLPANSASVNALKEAQLTQQAGFGDKDRTLRVDCDVRNTLQISPTKFKLKNPKWEAFVQKQTKEVADKFMVENASAVQARLYKLLIYEKGGFFKVHKDTEKEAGMFATMAIVLPCPFTGGSLKLMHNGIVKELASDANSEGVESGTVLAWYTDIDHEIMPITSGCRICLIYNMVMRSEPSSSRKRSSTPVPRAPSNLAESDVGSVLAARLRGWIQSHGGMKFLYLFDHQYSDMGLEDFGLKRRDKVVEEALRTLISQLGLRVQIELVKASVNESYGNDGGDIMFDEVNEIKLEIDSHVFGRISLKKDAVLQPVDLQRLGTLTGGGHMGNYPGDFSQQYTGLAILLYVSQHAASTGQASKSQSGSARPSVQTVEDVSRLTVAQLKDRLQVLGMPVSGRKQELVERLQSMQGGSGTSQKGDPLLKLQLCTSALLATREVMAHEITEALDACASVGATSSAVGLTDKLAQALIEIDEKEARRSVKACSKSIDEWENQRLVMKPTRDPLYELLVCSNLSFSNLSALQKVLKYCHSQYADVVNMGVATSVDYSSDASRVSDSRLKSFLAGPEEEIRLRLGKAERFSIHQQLHGIDVDHETVGRRGNDGTLVLRKRQSLAKFSTQKQQEDKRRFDELGRLTKKMAEHGAGGPALKLQRVS